ncbi:MAG: PAS domain S-box protein, partial [Armatimonadota bacterium]|nr:PAS domain S-box protein [Armatimonadota bacterium]
LRESEDLFRHLVEYAGDALMVHGLDGKFLNVNQRACETLGYTREELLNLTVRDIETEFDAAQIGEQWKQMPIDRPLTINGRQRRKDGTTFPVEVRVGAFERKGRTLILALARDVSERALVEQSLQKAYDHLEQRVLERTRDLAVVNEYLHGEIAERQQAEAALRESMQRYRFLADSMPQIVWTARPDGGLDYYNQRWYDYTGMTFEQTREWGWQPVIHPDDLPNCLARWTHSCQTGEPYEVEYRFKRANDGAYRWHLGRALPMRDERGQIVHWFGTCTDIDDQKQTESALSQAHDKMELRVQERTAELAKTNRAMQLEIIERARMENALRDNQHRLRTVIANAPIILFALNAWGEHEFCDGKALAALGIAPAALLGKSVFEVWPDHAQIQTNTRRALAGEDFTATLQLGEHTFDMQYSAQRDPEGAVVRVVGVGVDVTERQKMDQMKSEFISVVSHELRTPLTSIRGALGLMAGGVVGELPPQAETLVDIAHKNTERLVRLINDILDIEKIEAGRMDFQSRPQPVMPLVSQAISSLRAFGQQYQIEYVLEAGLPDAAIHVDADRFIQVLTNLLSNAAKFSPPCRPVRVSVSRHQSAVRIAVADRGPGIPPEFQPRIFQKFAQADSADTRLRGGTGLGLSISKAIVETFGGQIGFQTEPGQGTTFYIDLPECIIEMG